MKHTCATSGYWTFRGQMGFDGAMQLMPSPCPSFRAGGCHKIDHCVFQDISLQEAAKHYPDAQRLMVYRQKQDNQFRRAKPRLFREDGMWHCEMFEITGIDATPRGAYWCWEMATKYRDEKLASE